MTEPSSAPAASILVVDDEIQVLSFILELLRLQGYGVEGTWDPDEALRLARAHTGPLHLLLTDLVMPVMTGPELAREISRTHPAMKVLFMSGYSERAVPTCIARRARPITNRLPRPKSR